MTRRRMDGRSIVQATVVAGTTGAVQHAQNQHWAKQGTEAQAQYNQAYQQQMQYYTPPAGDDVTVELQQLADFYNRGLLADEEFVAAREKLLAA